jgi:hypothetical protein
MKTNLRMTSEIRDAVLSNYYITKGRFQQSGLFLSIESYGDFLSTKEIDTGKTALEAIFEF